MQTRSSSRLVSNPSSNPTLSINPNPKGRNRRRSKQRIEEFNLEELSPPIVTMADQRTMTQLLQAPTEGYEDRFDESFSEAWDRFKDLLRACPHHGFSELHQLDTFYNALNSKDQDSLNSSKVVAKVSTNTFTSGISPDVAELKDMVKALLLDKKSQNQSHATVKAVEESCVTCGGAHSYLSAPKPNLRPSITYLSRLQDQKLRDKANDQRENFFQILKDLNFNIRFADALILIPKFGPSIKSLLTKKSKLCELARTPLNEHCSAVLLNKLPEKLGDPGKFLILCDFPEKAEYLTLADLGASINLMPLFVWNKLSLPDLTPTCMNLELADRLISRPVGFAEDVYEVLGFSDVIASGNPTPYYDPIVSTTSLTLTPFKNSDFLLEEVDAFLAIEDDPTSPKELKICEAKSDKSSIDEPTEVELKDLHPHLEYAFLEGDDKLPVIIVKYLSMEEKTALITVLKSHKRKPHSPVHTERLLIIACLLGYAISFRERMLKRCEDTNLCLNWENSHFMVKEGIVLGHKVSKQGIKVDKAKVDVITKLPHPTTVKARPMTRLLKKDTPFIFSKECVEAFQTLKRKLTEAHILISPDWDMPFELMCDARDFAIGAVLVQRQDKHFKPIRYASKTMTKA
nr:reverse transcriptase domain-containing protein [Tanacetum cinerariifolium]